MVRTTTRTSLISLKSTGAALAEHEIIFLRRKCQGGPHTGPVVVFKNPMQI
jgi:hypothetical protein